MKKVARLRVAMTDQANAMSESHVDIQNAAVSEPIIRTTGRIKKPKAVFDPSDNYLPRSHRMLQGALQPYNLSSDRRVIYQRPLSTPTEFTSGDLCIVCQKREAKRSSYANKNKLIACLTCHKKIHKLCVKLEYDDFDILRQNFKCESCRRCEMCHELNNIETNEELLTCSKCIKSYHTNCHKPLPSKSQENEAKWTCNACVEVDNNSILPVNTIKEIIGDNPMKPKPIGTDKNHNSNCEERINDKIIKVQETQKQSGKGSLANGMDDSNVDASNAMVNSEKRLKQNDIKKNGQSGNLAKLDYMNVPDVKHWSVEQVCEFFAQYFPDEAHVFREQEIDGTSLLLLKRSDVVKKLPIKLGPSLRIYSLILKLQTRVNDPTLGWNCSS